MSTLFLMILTIIIGSAISLGGGALIFLTKKRRMRAIAVALPFGAGALLAAAFFDLLPESFEAIKPRVALIWVLVGFLVFFLLERTSGWFHHHHAHDGAKKRSNQNSMLMFGDLLHNIIDGLAIGASFLVSPVTGVITVLAVSAHEVPKELGTFGILISNGWRDRLVLGANILTAIGTIVAATVVYLLGSSVQLPIAEVLAITSGLFIYIAASDIIPEIHEQPGRKGILQSLILIFGIIVVAGLATALGV